MQVDSSSSLAQQKDVQHNAPVLRSRVRRIEDSDLQFMRSLLGDYLSEKNVEFEQVLADIKSR